MRWGLWASIASAGVASQCRAGTINFESPAIGYGSYPSVTLDAGSGVDAMFTNSIPGVVGITNLAAPVPPLPGRPASWGNQALVAASWLVSFDSLMFNEATIDFSYGTQGAGTAHYWAYASSDGTGIPIASGITAFSGHLNLAQTGSFTISTGQAFGSLRFSDSLERMYWDNLTLVAVPLPSAAGAGMLGLCVIGASRTRRVLVGRA